MEIIGEVQYPDGEPAPNALVQIEAVGDGDSEFFGYQRTDPAGKFAFTEFDPRIRKYRVTASYPEELWLRLGDQLFYEEPNGLAAEFEASANSREEPVVLRLYRRGGEVEFEVFDELSGAVIAASVTVTRNPVAGKTFPITLSMALGNEAGQKVLLPPGDYVASIVQFNCHGKSFHAAHPPAFPINVTEGVRRKETLRLNVAEIETKVSFANPTGRKCGEAG